jgi:hypothetical protein
MLKSKHVRDALKLLPPALRYEVYRQQLRLPTELPADLELKIATTPIELEQACAVLHDAYVDARFMDPHPTGLRLTPWHLMPTTTTAIAKWRGRVVATMSVIGDNPLGLPMEKAFDLSEVRTTGERLAEVSALAIDPWFVASRRYLLHPLIRFLWLESIRYLGIDRYVIAVNPSMVEFYEAFYLFRQLKDQSRVEKYDFVKGAPAVALHTASREGLAAIQRKYEGRPLGRNLGAFFAQSPVPSHVGPERDFYVPARQARRAEAVEYFLKSRTDLWNELDPGALQAMAQSYEQTEVAPVFAEIALPPAKRAERRYEVACPVDAIGDHIGQPRAVVRDVSARGLRVHFAGGVPRLRRKGDAVTLSLALGPGKRASVHAQKVWQHGEHLAGFRVSSGCAHWRAFQAHLAASGSGSGSARVIATASASGPVRGLRSAG